MIILDPNVISEQLRPGASAMVDAWLDRQTVETLYLTATSLSELLVGIELLPAGKRRASLAAALSSLLEQMFADRILPFDDKAARAYAPMVKNARAAGRAISIGDGQIAAIAMVHGFAVATRDTAPFLAAGVQTINPWTASV